MLKRITKISLISIILIVVLACTRVTYGITVDNFASWATEGLVGMFIWLYQAIVWFIFVAINTITVAITGIADGDGVGTIGNVVFNRCALTTANFFDLGGNIQYGTAMNGFVTNINKYYMVIRNLSIAILLGILLYVGIRMAISTVASDQAKYKKMLFDWTISLILVFVLHFIIIITFYINNQLVFILSKAEPEADFSTIAGLAAQALVPGYGLDELIVYGAFSIANIAFVLTYIKRTIVLGFLIVIAPLITITYSIDKMGDGKSQALNTWLKEFVFTVIIQPFHCIIYIVFYGATIGAVSGVDGGPFQANLGLLIFSAASAFFMLKAEGVVKKIFGIQPSGIGDAIGTGAMALTAATGLFGKNKGKKVDHSKGVMPDMKNNLENEKTGKKDGTSNTKTPEKSEEKGNSGSDKNSNNTEGSEVNDGNEASNNGESANQGNSSGSEGSSSSNNNSNNSQILSSEARAALDKSKKQKSMKERAKKLGMLALGGEKSFKRNGGWEGYMRRRVSGAATLAGLIAGGTVGDIKTAVSVGTAAGSTVSNLYDNAEYKRAERKLEKNQEVFAGAYEDFAEAYRAEHGDVDDNAIRNEIKRIYDGGGQNLTTEYERDFYSQMEQLSTSAEIMGYKNGYNYVDDTMRMVQDGVIEPNKDYVHKTYDKQS